MDLTLVPYQHQHQHQHSPNSPFPNLNLNVKYKECMKNHAASIGGHANDGCGEFMPPSDHGFTCAACGCHRNFHRREGSSSLGQQHLILPPPQQKQLFLYSAGAGPAGLKKHSDHDDFDEDDEDDYHDRRSETPEEVMNVDFGGKAAAKVAKSKRFRTKFTVEQKEKMQEFAEKIGWRINRHDDVALNQFCNEIGVKRNVLKVWMHNNKNARRRQEGTPPSSTVASAPPQTVGV